jgi:hypothetical protein
MTQAVLQEPGWSRQRWIACFALLLAVQVGLIFWLSEGPNRSAAPIPVRAPVRFALVGDCLQSSGAGLQHTDPTLFALVRPHGFSGRAWLTIPRMGYPLVSSREPLQWLALASDELGNDFVEFVRTNVTAEDGLQDRVPPAFAQPNLPTPLVIASTKLRVEGPLAGRAIRPDVPVPQPSEILVTNNTVIRVLVDGAGLPISAALLTPCGVPKADQDALAFARAVRFEPATTASPGGVGSPGALTLGQLVFQWARVTAGQIGSTPEKR